MYSQRRGGGRKAARTLAHAPEKRTTARRKGLHRRDHRRQRQFLRHGARAVYQTLAEVIRTSPPPFRVRGPHTPGRPPTDPREVARFLLLKALHGWSFDETYAQLEALPDLRQLLDVQHLPASSTVANLVPRAPVGWLERAIHQTALRLSRGRVNAAGDATGEGTRQYQRWFDVRHGKESRRQRFVKLHVLLATRARMPYFLAARVTKATRNESPELPALLDQLGSDLEVGNLVLDAGYMSRRNATLIVERGGVPVIDLKANVTHALAQGHPAWKAMVQRQRGDRRAHRCRYRRRTVVEGTFGALKARFGVRVKARRRHAQRVELLSRVLAWNILALVYHRR